MEMKLYCDTSELDAALEKLQLLAEETQRLQRLGLEVPGLAIATAIATSPRKLSRRSLFGLLKRR